MAGGEVRTPTADSGPGAGSGIRPPSGVAWALGGGSVHQPSQQDFRRATTTGPFQHVRTEHGEQSDRDREQRHGGAAQTRLVDFEWYPSLRTIASGTELQPSENFDPGSSWGQRASGPSSIDDAPGPLARLEGDRGPGDRAGQDRALARTPLFTCTPRQHSAARGRGRCRIDWSENTKSGLPWLPGRPATTHDAGRTVRHQGLEPQTH